jgi:putative PIG3 family NAD(P)H quinone oxidoreductase
MKAIVVRRPGGPEVLELAQVPSPIPAPNEVLVQVHATALNRADLLQRRGLYPPPEGASSLLGLECAGVVAQTGSEVDRAWLGKRVMALLPGGGYAEDVVVPAAQLIEIPGRLSFAEAAAIPEAFLTSLEALVNVARLGALETLYVPGAGSGIGTAAIQVARLIGARVIASAGRADKLERAAGLGAAVTFNRTSEKLASVVEVPPKGGIDVVLDTVGGASLEENLPLLRERGRWVVLGLVGGRSTKLDLARVLARRLEIRGLIMRTRSLEDKAAITAQFKTRLSPAFASGRLSPVIDTVFPLAEAQKAHERMENNENLGKIVLEVRPSS